MIKVCPTHLTIVATPILGALLLACATDVDNQAAEVTHQYIGEGGAEALSEQTEPEMTVSSAHYWVPADNTVDETRLPVGVKAQSREEAIEEDLGDIARSVGWSMDEARAYHRSERAIGRVAAKIAKLRPDVFVGSILSLQPTGAPELLIKGRVDAEVMEIVGREDAEIRIVDEQPFSAAELVDEIAGLRAELAKLGFNDATIAADITHRGNLHATVRRSVSTATLTSRAVLDRISQGAQRVDLDIVDSPILNQHASMSMGNVYIKSPGNPYTRCQTAFAVGQPFMGGWFVGGVLTAAHCSGLTLLDFPPTGAVLNAPWREEHWGVYGDMERHELTDVNALPSDDFYSTATYVRDVGSVEPANAISVNEFVCFYSRQQSLKDCTSKVLYTFATTVLGGINITVTAMDKNIAIGGDSGGGWFIDNVAYGVHSGSAKWGGVDRDVWSMVDWSDNALGVDSYVMH